MSLPFFKTLDEVTRVVKSDAPIDMRLDGLAHYLEDDDVRREFFALLSDDADWLRPLRVRGYFSNPPKDEARWPESEFLVRAAASAPREVCEIFASVPRFNTYVIRDLLNTALVIPIDVVATFLPTIITAVEDPAFRIHFNEASDLCLRLTEGDQYDAALSLAESLYSPHFDGPSEEPISRDRYWYFEGLKSVLPTLALSRPREFLPKLCEWLCSAIRAKDHFNVDAETDYSYVWRPAIEDHEQNSDVDFASEMVGLVRAGFEQAIRAGSLSLDESLQIINEKVYLVFRRLRVHLIGEFAEQAPELATATILDRELFDDYRFKHEYAILVGRRLDLLSDVERNEWFEWIDAGPDMSHFDESFRANMKQEPTDEDRQERIDWWRFEKLHCVRKHLEGEPRAFYERMHSEHGEPEMVDLHVRSAPVRWGNESPMTVDELCSMSFERAIETVAAWKPAKPSLTGPNVEGLGSTFEQYVATNPVQFSAQAQLLKDRPANFVRGFISQMTEAVKSHQAIDLRAVLDLSTWVVNRPVNERTTLEHGSDVLVDRDWQWTRDEVSSLVRNVCESAIGDDSRYSMEDYRESLWCLIARLCEDSAASYIVRDDSEDDPRIRDYLDRAINSPRGKALEAAFEYARWVGGHFKRTDGKRAYVDGGFDVMPEVCDLLTWQLAPAERSFEAMAIIGSKMGLIYWIDRNWLEENTQPIFDLRAVERSPTTACGWAVWNAFLVWVPPHKEYYRLFKSQFAYAVEQAATVQITERMHQPMHRLGEHLMVLYGRGQLTIDQDDGMLRRFLRSANADLRRHAIAFVGRSLERSSTEPIPDDVERRFMDLWDFYWNTSGKQDAAEGPDAWLFGTWVASGAFPAEWTLARLEEFVSVSPAPEPNREIARRFAEMAEVNTPQAVRILDRIFRGTNESWRIGDWIDPAKSVLESAMTSDDQTRAIASDLINYVGRRGIMSFRELLPSS